MYFTACQSLCPLPVQRWVAAWHAACRSDVESWACKAERSGLAVSVQAAPRAAPATCTCDLRGALSEISPVKARTAPPAPPLAMKAITRLIAPVGEARYSGTLAAKSTVASCRCASVTNGTALRGTSLPCCKNLSRHFDYNSMANFYYNIVVTAT